MAESGERLEKQTERPPLWSRARRRLRKRWRAWLRALHRDAGYLAVGLTFVYALSGIAINHIGQWDPNFALETETHRLTQPVDKSDEEKATRQVLAALQIDKEPADFFFEEPHSLEIYFNERDRKIIVDLDTGRAVESYKSDRFFIRVANWLHYNRGKSAWTYVADGYAVFLLFLAMSGLFMLKGRKGLIGRGGILLLIGAAVPIIYVQLSGGP